MLVLLCCTPRKLLLSRLAGLVASLGLLGSLGAAGLIKLVGLARIGGSAGYRVIKMASPGPIASFRGIG
jgi:hypothetical protein